MSCHHAKNHVAPGRGIEVSDELLITAGSTQGVFQRLDECDGNGGEWFGASFPGENGLFVNAHASGKLGAAHTRRKAGRSQDGPSDIWPGRPLVACCVVGVIATTAMVIICLLLFPGCDGCC